MVFSKECSLHSPQSHLLNLQVPLSYLHSACLSICLAGQDATHMRVNRTCTLSGVLHSKSTHTRILKHSQIEVSPVLGTEVDAFGYKLDRNIERWRLGNCQTLLTKVQQSGLACVISWWPRAVGSAARCVWGEIVTHALDVDTESRPHPCLEQNSCKPCSRIILKNNQSFRDHRSKNQGRPHQIWNVRIELDKVKRMKSTQVKRMKTLLQDYSQE